MLTTALWGRSALVIGKFTKGESTIRFDVKASVAIVAKFEKWDPGLTMTSPELSTAVLDIKIQAVKVNTGSV